MSLPECTYIYIHMKIRISVGICIPHGYRSTSLHKDICRCTDLHMYMCIVHACISLCICVSMRVSTKINVEIRFSLHKYMCRCQLMNICGKHNPHVIYVHGKRCTRFIYKSTGHGYIYLFPHIYIWGRVYLLHTHVMYIYIYI